METAEYNEKQKTWKINKCCTKEHLMQAKIPDLKCSFFS